MTHFRLTLPLVLLLTSAPLCAASAPSPEVIVALTKTASGDDPIASLAALYQLAESGDAGTAALRQIAPQLLARDSTAVAAEAENAAVSIPRLRGIENQMQPLRTSALQMIDSLTEDPESLKSAHAAYVRLAGLEARLSVEYAREARVASAVARKIEFAKLQLSPLDAKEDDRFEKSATQALAMPCIVAAGFLSGPLEPPAEADRRGLWLYLTSRRIDAWNKTIETSMNSGEIAHARKVNSYREMLGLPPFELDARLIQSARRHSKEMIDLWYFSHWSPTPSQRSPFARMAHAGYTLGSNENITMGPFAADDSFWNLFNSPEHHRAWVLPQNTAFGVGKWENAWTEDIGAGPRLMTASTQERAAASVRGDELKPQTQVVHNRPRDLSDIKIYDESGTEVGSGKNFHESP